ncbi:MAG: RNA 2'-phosphotransferase [Bacteroidota bacterium]
MKTHNTTSRFLSLVLRHKPETINLQLDPQGWVDVDVLLGKLAAAGRATTREELNEIVRTNNKKRFAFSEDRTKIRASQGHSVTVELGYEAIEPPELLYHGSAKQYIDLIRQEGLKKMSRHDVHLSTDAATATQVGNRHGVLVLLQVKAGEMHRAGHTFFRSANGVWLTDSVPPEYLIFPEN